MKPAARTCHFCKKTHGVSLYQAFFLGTTGHGVSVWAHAKCFRDAREKAKK